MHFAVCLFVSFLLFLNGWLQPQMFISHSPGGWTMEASNCLPVTVLFLVMSQDLPWTVSRESALPSLVSFYKGTNPITGPIL